MTTQRLAPEAIVCVPKSQTGEYRSVGLEILPHPDSVRGLTPKLNWILDRFKSEAQLLLLDDDLAALAKCFTSPGEKGVHSKDPVHIAGVSWARLAARPFLSLRPI